MQIEGTKLIFVMNFSVLDFFKFTSRMPQIAQILVSTFKIFTDDIPLDSTRNFLFFFISKFQALYIYVGLQFGVLDMQVCRFVCHTYICATG